MRRFIEWCRTRNAAAVLVAGLLLVGLVAVAAPAATRILNLYVLGRLSVGTTPAAGNDVTKLLGATTDYDFANTTIVCNDSTGVTMTGASVGDPCVVGLAAPIAANSTFSCHVTAANTAVVRHCPAGTAINPADAGFYLRVISSQ